MGKQPNKFGGGTLSMIGQAHVEDAPETPLNSKADAAPVAQEEKASTAKPKEKTTEPKPAVPRQKQSSLQDDFKKTQKGKSEEKKKKLIAIPVSYDKKISDMIEKGECESFNQLVNFLLDKFFEN